MKILFDTWPCAFDCMGGGEIQLLNYKNVLEEQGIEVLLYDKWHPQFDEVDIVHIFSTYNDGIFAKYVRNVKKIPIVVSPICWPARMDDFNAAILAENLRGFDKILPNSNAEIRLLTAMLGLAPSRFSRVVNGVDDIFFETVNPDIFRSRYHLANPYLLNVGNIEPRKNQLLLIEAVQELGLELVIIGSPRDREYYQQCLKASGEHVHFLGHLQNNSPLLRAAYAGAEAFVLPSHLETPGLAALEAAACGAKRIVATAVGSAREYLADYATYVSPDTKEHILEGICAALSKNPGNDGLRARVRDNFTWKHAGQTLVEVYEEVLNAQQKSIPTVIDEPNSLSLPQDSTKERPFFDLSLADIFNKFQNIENFIYAHLSQDKAERIFIGRKIAFPGKYIMRLEYSAIGVPIHTNIASMVNGWTKEKFRLEEGQNLVLELELDVSWPDSGIGCLLEVFGGDILFIHSCSLYAAKENPVSKFFRQAIGEHTATEPGACTFCLPLTHFIKNGSSVQCTHNLFVLDSEETLIYGPYMRLSPGEYMVTIEYSSIGLSGVGNSTEDIKMEFCTNSSKNIISKITCPEGINQIGLLYVNLGNRVEDAEIRIFIPGGQCFILHQINVSEMNGFVAKALTDREISLPVKLSSLFINGGNLDRDRDYVVLDTRDSVIFGPYMEMAAGDYIIDVEYSYTYPDQFDAIKYDPRVDFGYGKGKYRLAERHCPPGNNQMISLHVILNESVPDAEIRTIIPPFCLFVLHKITVKISYEKK